VRAASNWAGPIWCFCFGGINYQIEHHLFPTLYHGYYPLIAPVVRATAEEFGIPYLSFDTASAGLSAVHQQFLAANEGYRFGHSGLSSTTPKSSNAAYMEIGANYVLTPALWAVLAFCCAGACRTFVVPRLQRRRQEAKHDRLPSTEEKVCEGVRLQESALLFEKDSTRPHLVSP